MLTDVFLDAPMSMDQDVAMGLSPFYEGADAQMADHELPDDEMVDSYGASYDDVMTDDGVAYAEHPAVTHDVEIVDLVDEVPAAHLDSAIPVPHVGVEATFIDHIPQYSEPEVPRNDHDLTAPVQQAEPELLPAEVASEPKAEHADPVATFPSSDYTAAYAQEETAAQSSEHLPATLPHDSAVTAHDALPPTDGEHSAPGAEYVEPVYDPQPETGDEYHLQYAQAEEHEAVTAEATGAVDVRPVVEHDLEPQRHDFVSHETEHADSDAAADAEPVSYPADVAASDPVEYAEAPEFPDTYLPTISLSVFQMEHIRPPLAPEGIQNDELKRRPIGEQVVESTERKYDLFEAANETSDATLILDDQTALYSQRLSVLFETLRNVLHTVDGQQLTNFNDLTLYSPGLDLLIPEDNVLSHELTLEDLVNMLQRWNFTQFDLQLRIGAGHRAYDRYKWLQQQLEPAATKQDSDLIAGQETAVDQPEQVVDEHAAAGEHLVEGRDWAEDAEVGPEEDDDDQSSPAAEGEDDEEFGFEVTGDQAIGGEDGHAVADDSAWAGNGTEVTQTNAVAPVDGHQPEEFETHGEPADGDEAVASLDDDGTEQYEDDEWASGGEAEVAYADGEAEVAYVDGGAVEHQVLGEVELDGDDESAEYDDSEYVEGQQDLESAADDSEHAPEEESELPTREATGVDSTTTAAPGDNEEHVQEGAHVEPNTTQEEQHGKGDGDAAVDSAAVASANAVQDDQEADTNEGTHFDDTTDSHSQQAEQEEEEWYEEGDVADVGDSEPYNEDDQATLSSAEDTSQPAPLATGRRPNLSPAGSKRSHDELLRDNPDQDAGLEDDADHDYKRVRIE